MPSTLVCDDVLQWAETYAGPQFHAMLLDGPYGLGFMGKSWDRPASFVERKRGSDSWDHVGGNHNPINAQDAARTHYRENQRLQEAYTVWFAALARHLLPGAFVMAFASSRGYHRLACAMEDVGLVLNPSIFLYCYGSGFPKATRIPDDRFEGHRYGLQAMKPAAEPIIVAQVPYAGRSVDNITQHGSGALNIDAGRIAGQPGATRFDPALHNHAGWRMNATGAEIAAQSVSGRWPANFALCHLPACEHIGTRQVPGTNIPGPGVRSVGYSDAQGVLAGIQQYATADGTETVLAYQCAEGCPVAVFDAQVGERPSSGRHGTSGSGEPAGMFGNKSVRQQTYFDAGSVSRFFHVSDWSLDVAEQLAHADPVRYTAKASAAERQAGTSGRNPHPCIKPLTLVRWLATLLLPPSAYAPRRLLVPFCGTGSEMIGGILAGWEMVFGIECDPVYVTLAEQRLAWWTGMRPHTEASPHNEAPVRTCEGSHTQLSLL